MDGEIYVVDVADEAAAEREAESMMERGDPEIDWAEPEDAVFAVERIEA